MDRHPAAPGPGTRRATATHAVTELLNAEVLVVEDEPRLARLVADYLLAAGAHPQILSRGDAVLPAAQARMPQLIVLDLMLPGTDGLSLCRALRAFSDVPIIMLTARVDEVDRLIGLEAGADDYICKPFSPREVVARVKAVLRRSTHAAAAPAPPNQGLHLDDGAWRATFDGHDLGLTAVEYQLLKVLSARPGRIFSREQLMELMYRDERIVSDRTVDSHIKKLRRKIQEHLPEQELIHSVYGLGYKFEPPL